MQCQECKQEISEHSVYCPHCGARLDEQAPQGSDPPAAGQESSANNAPSAEETLKERFLERANETQSDEADREHPLWEGGYSAKTMLGNWVGCAVVSVLGIVAAVMLGASGAGWFWLLLAIVAGWIVNLIVLAYRRLNIHYRLTDQRFFHEKGILKRITNRIELIDIDDITFEQPLFQRIMGVGTILISSSDKTDPELRLFGIDRVTEVSGMIDDARRVERRRRGLHIESI